MGAERFVLFGSCGVLDDEKVQGKIIIPVSAVRDEGTSYHYAAPSSEIKADERYVDILERVLKNCGCPYVKGRTVDDRRHLQRNSSNDTGEKGTGMPCSRDECASMIAASQYRKIPFYPVPVWRGQRGTDKWEIRDLLQYGLNGAG